MSISSFGGQDPFADLLGRFFGMSPASSPPAVQRVPIGRLLTDSARELLTQASVRAQADGSPDLDTEHLLWAATQAEPTRTMLASAGADPDRLAKAIEAALPGESGTPSAEPGLTPAAKRVLLGAHARSQATGTSYIGAEHILAAILDDPDSGAGRLLNGQSMDARDVSRRVEGATSRAQGAAATSNTPTLDQYGRDLTEDARAGKLDPVVGRADEIEQTIEILSRRAKNNPVLIGEHGVGATTIDEYRRHIEKDAALERRFQPVLIPEPSVEETIQILEGLRDAYEAHHQVRFADDALVAAAELSDRYVSDRFLPDKAIDLVDQAGARVRLRSLGKSTDVVSREEERREGVMAVTANDIAEILSKRTGIPVAQLTESEKQRLLGLEDALHERVVGQDEAVV